MVSVVEEGGKTRCARGGSTEKLDPCGSRGSVIGSRLLLGFGDEEAFPTPRATASISFVTMRIIKTAFLNFQARTERLKRQSKIQRTSEASKKKKPTLAVHRILNKTTTMLCLMLWVCTQKLMSFGLLFSTLLL